MTRSVRDRYMAEVDQALIRQLRLREQMLDQIGKMVDQFGEENPEATYDDLLSAFGPADALVEEMLSTLPTEEVEQAKNKRQFQHRAVALLLALVLVVTALFFFWRWRQAQEIVNGDFKVVIDPAEELTDEEMKEFFEQAPSDAQLHTGE